MNRKIIIGFILMWLLFAGPACTEQEFVQIGNEPSAASIGVPIAIVKEAQFQFDPLFDKNVVEHDFVIENTGTAPLVIKDVKTACRCTINDFDKVIPPSGSGKISVKITT